MNQLTERAAKGPHHRREDDMLLDALEGALSDETLNEARSVLGRSGDNAPS
jgi:hypothetical protein